MGLVPSIWWITIKCVMLSVLKTNFANYPKGPMFSEAFKDLLGEGIFAVDGHKWKTQRKTASHEFTVKLTSTQ